MFRNSLFRRPTVEVLKKGAKNFVDQPQNENVALAIVSTATVTGAAGTIGLATQLFGEQLQGRTRVSAQRALLLSPGGHKGPPLHTATGLCFFDLWSRSVLHFFCYSCFKKSWKHILHELFPPLS